MLQWNNVKTPSQEAPEQNGEPINNNNTRMAIYSAVWAWAWLPEALHDSPAELASFSTAPTIIYTPCS